jgi:hypothetical protein
MVQAKVRRYQLLFPPTTFSPLGLSMILVEVLCLGYPAPVHLLHDKYLHIAPPFSAPP